MCKILLHFDFDSSYVRQCAAHDAKEGLPQEHSITNVYLYYLPLYFPLFYSYLTHFKKKNPLFGGIPPRPFLSLDSKIVSYVKDYNTALCFFFW